MRTWKDDAREYGRIAKKGGWWLAFLAARNVVEGTGQGARNNLSSIEEKSPVCSIVQFAREAGTSDMRVKRHLEAWDRAADAGLVPPRATFVGREDVNVPMPNDEDEPFTGWYDASTSVAPHIKGTRRDDIIAAAQADGVGVSKTLDVAQNRKAVVAAIKADPELAAAVAADPAAHVAVARERNRIDDSRGARDPEALDRKREEDRVADGASFIEVLDLATLAHKVMDLAAKFRTPPEDRQYSESTRTQVDASILRIRAAADLIEGVVHGTMDTRIPDDLSGLVSE